jgi:hypothetical protein
VLKVKGGTMAADKNKKTFDDVPSESVRRFPRGPVDWGAVLAELEAKRAALDKAIASIRSVIATGVLFGVAEDSMPPMADSVVVGLHGGEVPVGAFLSKSIPEAAKLCLQITKRKMTTREITDALQKGGIETTAKTSFPAIVHSVLMRAARTGSGGIMKLDRSHWGLADWYPASMRSSVPTNRAKGKKRQKASRKSKVAAPKSDATKEATAETVPQKIWEVLNKPGVELSAMEIADKVGTKSNVAAMLLGSLIRLKSAEKIANGKYRAIRAA